MYAMVGEDPPVSRVLWWVFAALDRTLRRTHMNDIAPPEEAREPARRGRSRTVLGLLVGSSLLLLLIIAAWLGGWLGRSDHGNAKALRPIPVADLKVDLATPLDAAAAPAELSLQDSLAAVIAGVDAKAKLLDDDVRFASKTGDWGDPRKASEDDAPTRNWELRFLKGNTKDKYARQLDFFGIELAVVMPGNSLVYVRNFSKKQPEKHTGPATQEKRCYLTWQNGDLSRADAELLQKAGISPGDRVVLKILPAAVEATLAKLEKEHAGDELDNVSKTQFSIRAAGDGYEFYVSEQYRKEQATK